jgi:hypothetical protein
MQGVVIERIGSTVAFHAERHGVARSPALAGITGAAGVDRVDDLGVVGALQLDRRDAEVACPNWR